MVATVIGSRLGLEQTSAWVLGSRGQLGSSVMGRGGEGVTVNALTGNLVVTNQDEFLIGLGPDSILSRTYNSQGALDGDNNDGWRIGAARRVFGLTGSQDMPGSTITRTDWDGSQVAYGWDADRSAYVTTEGAGAYDTLKKVGSDWIWTDGDTGTKEVYQASSVSGEFRITSLADIDGRNLSFAYNGSGYISKVTTHNGGRTEYTDLTWSGAKLTQLTSTYWDVATSAYKTQTRTRYAYDGQERLTSVTVDLSPTDNAVSDGKTYITTYTYSGTSTRVASISQSDGSRIEIEYEPSGGYRVTAVTQWVASDVSRRTEYDYIAAAGGNPPRTEVKDISSGLVTSLEYDITTGRLTKITEPAAIAGGTPQVREFTYDPRGNVTRVQTSPTTWTEYRYEDTDGTGSLEQDVDGNGLRNDENGLWTHEYRRTSAGAFISARRTYNAQNLILTDTRYQSLDADTLDNTMPGDPLTTRFVYDPAGHLRFVVTPNGEVTRHDYSGGNVIQTTTFTGADYPVSGLAWNASIAELLLDNWAAGLADKTAARITKFDYDFRGAITSTVAYSKVLSTGLPDLSAPLTQTNYVYDQSGRLLSRAVAGVSGSETFIYDGLGRMVSSVDFTGAVTSSVFLDTLGTTVIRRADGLNEISVYNRAGELVSRTETDRSENLVNLTGWPQGSPPSGAATVPGWGNPAAYANETQWAVVAGPDGRQVVAIQSGQTVNSANGGGNFTNAVPIDPTKAMEFVFYFRKSDLTRHSIYFGVQGAAGTVEHGTTGADDNNPYFFAATAATQQALLQNDRWYKVIGYVLPQGAGLVASGSLGGVYDTTTGAKVASTNTFRWNDTLPANPQVQGRFFNYYDETNIGLSTYFYQAEIRQFSADLISELLPAAGTQYRYDNQGRLRLQIDPTGAATHHLYDRVGRKVAEIDGDGSLVEYKYDLADRLVATVRYATRLTPAQIASLADAAGNPTGVELAAVRPTGVAGDSWNWTVYDDAGRVLQTIDGTGATTAYTYDGASRLQSETRYAARLTTGQIGGFKTTLPTAVLLPGTTAGADRTTRYFYDNANRRIGALDAEGYFSRVVYDRAGRVIGTDAFAEKVTNTTLLQTGTYAALLAEVQSPANTANISTWSVYDGRGFLRGTVNGEGDVTLYDYSPLGHITQVVTGRKLASVPTGQPTLTQLVNAPIPLQPGGAAGELETTNYTRNAYGQVLTESRAVSGGTETVTYSYDALRRLVATSVDRVAGQGPDYGTRQRYDRRGRLIGQLGGEGTAALLALGGSPTRALVDGVYRQWGTTFVYDDADRLISRTDADGVNGGGNRTLYFYDPDGNLAYQINGAGEVVGYAYDGLNRQTKSIVYAERLTAGQLTGLTGGKIPALLAAWSRTTPAATASVTTFAFEVTGAVLSSTDALGASTAFAYNAFGELTSRTDPTGTTASPTTRATTYVRDRRGAATQTVEDSGAGRLNLTRSAVYDAFGRAIRTTDARGSIRETTYDRAGRIVVFEDANDQQTTYAYDARGNQISVTSNGHTTTFAYSAYNRQLTVKTPENITTTTTYDSQGQVLTLVDGGGRTMSYAYNHDGALISETNGLNQVSTRAYDSAGRLSVTTDAAGRAVSFGYDAANRVLTTTVDPGGLSLVTTYEYDAKGQQVKVINAGGVRTDYLFDLAGRATEMIVDPAGLALRTQFQFDRAGNLTRLRQAAGTSTQRDTFHVYDAADRRIITVDAAGTVTRYFHDGEGGVTRTLVYADALNQAERTALGAAPTAAQAEANVTANAALDRSSLFVYDAEARPVLTVDAMGGVVRTFFDADGRVTRTLAYSDALTQAERVALGSAPTVAEVLAYVTANTALDRSTAYAYDDDGRLVFAVDAVGSVTENVYDGSNLVLRQIRYAGFYTASQTPTEAQLRTWTAANQTGLRKTQFIYDAAGRAAYVVDAAGYVTRTIYDAAGLVTEEARFAPVFSVADNSTTTTVAALLTTHEADAAKTSYDYDSAGRRFKVTDAMLGVTTTEFNALGQEVKVTDPRGSVGYFYYDTAGRLTLQVDPEKYWTRTVYGVGEEILSVTRGVLKVTGTPVVGTPPTTPTHADDAVTSFVRDNLGRVTRATDAEGHFELYTLNAFGDRISVTNKIGGVTTYAYDLRGLMISELLPITSMQGSTPGNVVNEFQYDAFGNMTRSIEAATLSEQRITDFEYDKLDRLTKKIGQAVTVTSSTNFSTSSVTPTEIIKYDGFGNVTETTDAAGARTLFYYDALNRKTGEIDALGTRRTWTYDSRSNATAARAYDDQSALPAGPTADMPTPTGAFRETTFAYDKNNRLTSSSVAGLWTGHYVTGSGYTTADSPVTNQQFWDAAGNLVEVTDGRGVKTFRFYDLLGRQVAAVDGEGYLTTWTRDAEGNVTKEVRYGIKVVGAMAWDRLISTLPPRTADAALGDRITDFTYDRNGRRETETRRGVAVYAGPPDADRMTVADATIVYTYDGLGNVRTKTEANLDSVEFWYDAAGRQIRSLSSAFTDYLGASVRRETLTAYNGWDGVTRTQDGKEGGLLADARVTTFTYTAGRLTSTTDATGFTVHFGHDAVGRVVKESYDRVRGDLPTVTEGRRYTYDALGRVIVESSASTNGTWSFGDGRGLVYNAHGEVTSKTLNGVTTERFYYDAGGRMWQTTAGDGVIKLFLHDGAGNITLTYASAGLDLQGTTIAASIGYIMTGGVIDGGSRTDITTTFTQYDGRGMLLGSIEPKRQLSRDLTTGVYTMATVSRSRAYNAFGEVVSETDARGFTTDFTYNTMGRIIEQRSPEVAFTNEQGVVANARPTEQRRYDISGRLVATRTANGYWTSRTLLAGSGHNGQEAVVTGELFPDQGTKAYGVDVFGDVRKITDQLGFVTLQNYDKAGRLISVQHPGRAAYTPGNNTALLVQLTDYYAYDGLGQRIQHWNSQFGTGFKEKTVYDREGRVVSQIDFENRATTYAWTWDATLTTTGLGTFGGWIKTTTHASGKTGVEKLDSFGRLTAKTDLGGRTYAMGFDKGGRQLTQTSSAGQSLTWNWYNTGLMSRQTDVTAGGTQADYAYDVNGARTRERYATGSAVRQDGYAEYDALGRMTRFEDRSANASDPTRTVWTYDLNGNIRSSQSNYRNVTAAPSEPTVAAAALWNRYDGMDRMVRVEAGMTDGAMWGGRYLEYDAAGNRRRMLTETLVQTDNQTGWGEVWVPDPDPGGGGPGGEVIIEDPGGGGGHWEFYPTYELRPGFNVENYDYTADGYLSRVGKSQDEWNTTTDTVVRSAITWKSEDVRDAMGRLTYRWENSGIRAEVATTYTRTATYDKAGQVLTEQTFTYIHDNIFTGVTARFNTQNTTYSYFEGSTWRGVVTAVTTTGTTDVWPLGGSTSAMAATSTTYAYNWWDDARQATITYDSDTGSGSNPIHTSTFNLDVNGRVNTVVINDARPRTVTFVSDANGQVLTRTELDNNPALEDPKDQYFYFSGRRIGEVTNNGSYVSTYQGVMYARANTGPATPTPFHNGNYDTPAIDFDLAYEALTPNSIRSGGTSWTIRDGDTLQGIAAAVWGDASLWYMIAEANGLTSASILVPGQTLTVPAKVGNVHNTSETFRPYDPNQTLGNVSPSQVKPPKQGGGCGVIGQMLMVIIAVAVTIWTAGALGAATGGILGAIGSSAVATGAVAGAAGSIASQVFGLATGIQDKFDWKGVALAAIAGGVGGGVSKIGALKDGADAAINIAKGVARGAIGNVITQGVSVATGLQSKFDWTGVALGGVSGGVFTAVSQASASWAPQGSWANQSLSGAASAVSSAATRSLLQGTSFGDNLIAALPDVIGSTIGSAIASGVVGAGASRASRASGVSASGSIGPDENGNRYIYQDPDDQEAKQLDDVWVFAKRKITEGGNWLDRLRRGVGDFFTSGTGGDFMRQRFNFSLEYRPPSQQGPVERGLRLVTRAYRSDEAGGASAINRFVTGTRDFVYDTSPHWLPEGGNAVVNLLADRFGVTPPRPERVETQIENFSRSVAGNLRAARSYGSDAAVRIASGQTSVGDEAGALGLAGVRSVYGSANNWAQTNIVAPLRNGDFEAVVDNVFHAKGAADTEILLAAAPVGPKGANLLITGGKAARIELGAAGLVDDVARIRAAESGNVASNAALHVNYVNLLRTTEAANPLVDSLRATGGLPANYVTKADAALAGWQPGKAIENFVPGGQIGGDVFRNSTNLVPPAAGRVWYEADVGLVGTMTRANQPGTRLLYSNDGHMYVTFDHYATAHPIGSYK